MHVTLTRLKPIKLRSIEASTGFHRSLESRLKSIAQNRAGVATNCQQHGEDKEIRRLQQRTLRRCGDKKLPHGSGPGKKSAVRNTASSRG